jgi:cold shock CspA family protein
MFEGTIRKFFSDKGFGFIIGDDGTDHFFHVNDSKGDHDTAEGTRVLFTLAINKRNGREQATIHGEGKPNAKPNPIRRVCKPNPPRYGNDPREWSE